MMGVKTITEVPSSFGHNRMEQYLKLVLKLKGYDMIDISYHHILPEEDSSKIRREDSPASLYYRTTPDFLTFNKGDSYFIELKCGNSNNVYLEALPLAFNQDRDTMGVRCLYVYAGPVSDFKLVCCWAGDIVPAKLIIPKRNKSIKEILKAHYTCPIEEREPRSKKVSGDAYVVVREEDVKKWRPLEEFL